MSLYFVKCEAHQAFDTVRQTLSSTALNYEEGHSLR